MVGRCNHESSCGYHYTPKQYFEDNPQSNQFEQPMKSVLMRPVTPQPKPADYIPKELVLKSISYKSNFVYFLCSILDIDKLESPTIVRVCEEYFVGATKDNAVIFWQIDVNKNVRTGKIIRYDTDGHRIKDVNGINWIHAVMKRNNQLKSDFNLCQCLFGEHLLTKYPDKDVAIVEAEKTAVICASVFPKRIWLATGGKSQLSKDKMKVLKGRNVIMFPDVDGFNEWSERAKELTFCKSVIVSDVLEKNATDEQRAKKIDIADWIVEDLRLRALNSSIMPVEQATPVADQLSATELILREMEAKNPYLRVLVEQLQLEIVEQ
jgi:hypothetical protein